MLLVRRIVAHALSPGGCFSVIAIVLFDGHNLFLAT